VSANFSVCSIAAFQAPVIDPIVRIASIVHAQNLHMRFEIGAM